MMCFSNPTILGDFRTDPAAVARTVAVHRAPMANQEYHHHPHSYHPWTCLAEVSQPEMVDLRALALQDTLPWPWRGTGQPSLQEIP